LVTALTRLVTTLFALTRLTILWTGTITGTGLVATFFSLIIICTRTIACTRLTTIIPRLGSAALQACAKALGTEAALVLTLSTIETALIVRTCLLMNTRTW
jgi:hypothetical protein